MKARAMPAIKHYSERGYFIALFKEGELAKFDTWRDEEGSSFFHTSLDVVNAKCAEINEQLLLKAAAENQDQLALF